jgi:nucleotide-binding universal stress UspA family protein
MRATILAVTTVLLCTDGSDPAIAALRAGLAVLAPAERLVVANVADLPDESLVTGVSGFAGGSMSPEAFDQLHAERLAVAEQTALDTIAALGIEADTAIVEGPPGPALCDVATDLAADVIVMGSRGRGGLKRAFLGSVSDHVVRNATCPVVITGDGSA